MKHSRRRIFFLDPDNVEHSFFYNLSVILWSLLSDEYTIFPNSVLVCLDLDEH